MKTACPEDELIADYLEGRLSEKDRFEVEKHVSACEGCLERFVISGNLLLKGKELKERVVPQEVTESAIQMLLGRSKELRKDSVQVFRDKWDTLSAKVTEALHFRPLGEVLLQPVRGGKSRLDPDAIVIRKTFKDFKSELEIERKGDGRCHIRVVVSTAYPTPTRFRVTLKHGDREVASQLIEKDSVVFEEIPFGRYKLLFYDRGTHLGSYAFEVTETGCGEN